MRYARTLLAAALLPVGLCTHVAWAVEAAGAQVAASAVLPANLPLRRDAAREGEPASWTLPLLAVTLAGASGAWTLWLRSRRAAGHRGVNDPGRLVRLSSQALTGQASVHAVRWNSEELLLACSGQQVTLIARRSITRQEGDVA